MAKKTTKKKDSRRPYILVCNDDGISAKGIAAVICALQPFADLLVVAPDGPRSGTSAAITSDRPITYRTVTKEPGLTAIACTGTPVDCTKLALEHLCERRPELIVSGINLGENSSVCTYYSGTMAVVYEGCIKGIPSVGFSLQTNDPLVDYSLCLPHVERIVKHVLDKGLPPYVCLNVNFPTHCDIKGLRVCRMAMGDWVNEFKQVDCPRGGTWYWLTGEYQLRDSGTDHDAHLLADGYGTIVPIHIDMTAYKAMKSLKKLEL